MYFDARAAKLLQPGQHMVVDGCQGLRLVATAQFKTWTYRYKADDGRMKQIALGRWPDVPASTAATLWQQQRDARASGVDPRAAKKAKKSPAAGPVLVRHIVQDFIDGHLKDRKGESGEAAVRKLRWLLEAHPDFAAMEPAAVTRGVAFDLVDSMKATPMAAVKVKGMLGGAWDYALDAGRIGGEVPNWWRMVHKGRLKSKGKILLGKHVGRMRRVLSADEVGELLRWSPAMHQHGHDMLVLYMWTCTRGGEIAAMRREHLREDGGVLWWTVPKAATKNARYDDAVDLRVPLFGRARKVVERRLKAVGENGWVFTGENGEQYRQKYFSTYVYTLQPYSVKVVNRASTGGLVCPVFNWSPHKLRHTSRTLLASMGCPQEVGEAIMGHMPEVVVDTYNAYTYDAERVVWLKKLSERLEGLVGAGAVDPTPARPTTHASAL